MATRSYERRFHHAHELVPDPTNCPVHNPTIGAYGGNTLVGPQGGEPEAGAMERRTWDTAPRPVGLRMECPAWTT